MSGRMVIIRYENKILSCLIQDNRLIEAAVSGQESFLVGDIVIAKVKNVVKNINAAFVDMGENILCFLPLTAGTDKLVPGDEIAVQVEREAVKTKEAVVTTELSFPGKYAVVTTGRKGIGFSAKLSKQTKENIKELLREQKLPYGVIIRTNAGGLTDYKVLAAEIEALTEECEELLGTKEHRTCYSVLRKSEPAFLTFIRNTNQDSYDKILTDDSEIYERIRKYLQTCQPEDMEKASLYQDESISLKNLYSISSKLEEALGKQVWLRSGGYLVIEPTEALTVIDVNTGKYTGKKTTQETYFLINKEACKEIAIQLRLRNLSGIIMVDFINMEQKEKQQELLQYLNMLLRKDSIKCSVVDMTALGLVEITRKKINKTLKEQLK